MTQGTKDITIQGITFPVSQPFHEGYVLTAPDAHVLNQTYAENIRNNVAGIVRDAKRKAAADAGFFKPAAEGEPLVGDESQAPIDEMDLDDLRAKIAEYEDNYEFAVGGRGPRAPVDPVAREALNQAKDLVKAAYRTKYPGNKLPPAAELNAKAQLFLDNDSPKAQEVKAEARRRVEAAKASQVDLGDIDL